MHIMLAILNLMEKPHEKIQLLLGRRIRALRKAGGLTQEELGDRADINYKFLGEIERGQQNPSFRVMAKIASGLGLELPQLFRFEQEIPDRNEIEARINDILKLIPDNDLRQVLLVLRVLYPLQ